MTTSRLVLATTLAVVGSLPVFAQDPIRDRDVKFTAEVALRRNPALFDTRFDLDVSGGRVVVEGTVRSLRKAWEALETIAKIQGVTTIDDRIRVDSSGYADERIRSALRRRLEDIPALENAGVEAEVRDGVATLTGKVGDARLRFRAREAAAEVDGVVGVVDRIESPEADDEAVAKGVETVVGPRALTGIPGLVEVAVVEGVVTLAGEVPTLYARMQAERLAFGVNGVRAVQNFLEVVPRRGLDEKMREAR